MPQEGPRPQAEEDSQFGERAVKRGFVTGDQVKEAEKARKTILGVGLKKSLAEIMLEKGLMTKQQAEIVGREVESGGKVKFIGQYELIEKLGEGGMGVVYKAREPSLDRVVALKVLPPNLARDEKFVARFQREARMAAKLDHVNIVRALAVGEAEGLHYFAMEFVEGRPVGDILDEKGVMSEEEAVAVVMQIARALKHAWDHKLIHRDIKPDNILVTNEGVAKLADLGLARTTGDDSTRMTQTGTAMGTPYYISPEQARGERDVDIRTDIYSLGVTLYHMVTGEVPFQGSTAAVVITKRLTEEPPKAHEKNPRVSVNTGQVIERMMARDREMRYRDPAELLGDIELVADGKAPDVASQMTLMGDSVALIEKDLARLKETRALVTGEPSKKLVIGAASAGAALVVAIVAVLVVALTRGETPPAPVRPPVAAATDQPRAKTEDIRRAGREKEAAGRYKTITELIKSREVRAALKMAQKATEEYADTSYASAFESMANQLDARLALAAASAGTQKPAEDEKKRQEEQERRRREKLAETEYARVTRMMGAGQLNGAAAAAKSAVKEYADTSWRDRFDELARDVAAKIEETRLAEEKAKKEAERRAYELLVRKGDAALAKDRFDDALSAYESALRIKDSPDLRRKVLDANFRKFVASARRLEAGGDLDGAIASCAKALELRDDQRIRGKIKELNDLKKFREELARAEKAENSGEIDEAIAAYGAALRFAPEAQTSRISARIRALRKAKEYEEFMAAARAGVAARDWRKASGSAGKAISVRPGDAEAKAILDEANRRLSLPPQIENSLGMKLMLVRAGTFEMGAENGETDEKPVREVLLDGFYVSETEITNAQYEKFDPSHAPKRKRYSTGDDSPAVCVSWQKAAEFCRWLGSKESRTYKLPTEAEWERAARGTDGREYPWGNSPASEGRQYRLNFGPGEWRKTGKKDGHLYCSPVGSYPAGVSPAGCHDMAGNVWEWCLDWYSEGYYAQAPKENPTGPPAGGKRVLRGGAWSNDLTWARCANRHGAPPSREDANIGFRVVLVVE